MLSPNATYTHVVTPDRLDFGLWADAAAGETLVLGANLNYGPANVSLAAVLNGSAAAADVGSAQMVFDGGAQVQAGSVVFGSVQSGAWVVKTQAAAAPNAGAAQSSGARRRWARAGSGWARAPWFW
jgi:hypothetical protein